MKLFLALVPMAVMFFTTGASAENSVQNDAAASSSQVQQPLEWVPISNGGSSAAPTAQQQIQTAFPASAYGAQNYPVQQQTPPGYFPAAPGAQTIAPTPGMVVHDDGTRGLFPPGQLSAFEVAKSQVSPFKPDEIRDLAVTFDESREAKAYKPVRALPRISSVSVDLAPGSSMPVARMLPGTPSSLIFIDATGAPWPLAAPPRISDARVFFPEWLKGTHVVVVSALSPYESGTLTVFLQGLPTPVVVQLSTGEEGTKESTRDVDVRLDIRVPGRGPNAKAPVVGPGKIELYDDTLQAFLDGLPPMEAKPIKAIGSVPAGTKVYQLSNELYVRTTYDLKSPFDQTSSSANGTRVYRMPLTPYVTFSDMGRSVTVQLDIF